MNTSDDVLRFTILGCGSSPGVPRITGDWGACDPLNPKNRRLRASMLVERINGAGDKTSIVIDTGPDFRQQMINASVSQLDGVVYTHPHADHIHGIDDLRGFVIDSQELMRIYADAPTLTRLRQSFGYIFKTEPGSSYPPIAVAHEISPYQEISIDGPAGPIKLTGVEQQHGGIVSLGFRIGNVAYCSDVSQYIERSYEWLNGLEVLVIDALQYRPHPSHFSLEQSLKEIMRIGPKRAILTHMHTPLDYETVKNETPPHVEPGFDGLQFETGVSDV